jgi:K+-sensing histidine kinase KdpD
MFRSRGRNAALISVAAAVCLDFFFLPPLLSLHIADPLNTLALLVFLVIALVVNHLVSRLGAADGREQRRGTNVEQLHNVTRHLLLATPDHDDAAFLLKTFREGFTASAACLFDADTPKTHVDGNPRSDLSARTNRAYLAGEDVDDHRAGIVVRCLHGRNAMIGAIGFEDLADPEWVAGPSAAAAWESIATNSASYTRGPPIPGYAHVWFRNQQVAGSNPTGGSRFGIRHPEEFASY